MAMKAGIAVVDQWEKKGVTSGKRWLFRVWDPDRRAWKSKAFGKDEKRAGHLWAEGLRSRLNQRLAATGTLSLAAVGADYVRLRRERGLGEENIGEIGRVVDAVVEAGAADLLADDFADRVGTWISGATSFAKGRTMALSPVTKNRWLRHLKSVALHAVGKRYGLPANPLDDLQPMKEDQTITPHVRVEEMRAMVADYQHPIDPYFLPGCFLTYAGMRVGEAHHVRWEWIDFAARTIHVRVIRDDRGKLVWAPKRNKERIIPLLGELAEILLAWPWRAATGYVTEWDGYRKLENKGHWLAYRRYLKRCGVEPRDLHPHCSRHSWASIRLATGESATSIRRAMGHDKLETTDGYAEAEHTYRDAVRGWPRGELCLRRAPSEIAADPLAFIREHVQAGGRLDQLAATAGVPIATCESWLRDGLPEPARQYAALFAARQTTR